MLAIEQAADGAVLQVKAKAGSRRNGIAGIHDDCLIVAVTQVPQKGKANAAIIQVLSDCLGIAKQRCELIGGATSSRKRFLIQGISVQQLQDECHRLLKAIDPS